jgi:hypothetical protein
MGVWPGIIGLAASEDGVLDCDRWGARRQDPLTQPDRSIHIIFVLLLQRQRRQQRHGILEISVPRSRWTAASRRTPEKQRRAALSPGPDFPGGKGRPAGGRRCRLQMVAEEVEVPWEAMALMGDRARELEEDDDDGGGKHREPSSPDTGHFATHWGSGDGAYCPTAVPLPSCSWATRPWLCGPMQQRRAGPLGRFYPEILSNSRNFSLFVSGFMTFRCLKFIHTTTLVESSSQL